jgi:hypothetical protein
MSTSNRGFGHDRRIKLTTAVVKVVRTMNVVTLLGTAVTGIAGLVSLWGGAYNHAAVCLVAAACLWWIYRRIPAA